MPFAPNERVDWIPLRTDTPDTAVFTLYHEGTDQPLLELTTANGGLVPRRKGALHPVFNVPRWPGKFPYTFTDGTETQTGHVRVNANANRKPTREARKPTVTPFEGVRVRRGQ